MKLLQLNMWAGRLEGALTNLLKTEAPDILCLQEAISHPKEDAAFFLTIEQIQKLCDMPYSSFGPMFSFNLMNSVASWGNCIISRYPILKSEVVFTRLEHQENFDFNDHDGNVRNFVHAELSISGQNCHVITHHGHHVREHKNGDQETLRQMRILEEYIAVLEGPVIVAGDFNLSPHSKSLEAINNKLDNLSVRHNLRTTRTALTNKTEVCDYIFVSPKIKVKNFNQSEALVSDHKALILDFTI